MRKQLLLLLVLSISIALSLPVFFGGGRAFLLLAHISTTAVATLLAIVVLTWLFNAVRVFLLFRGAGHSVGFWKTLSFILACDFSVKATPAGIGGPITAITVLRKYGIYPAKTVAAFSLLFALDVTLVIVLSVMLYPVSFQEWGATVLVIHITAIVAISAIALIFLLKLPRYYRRFVIGFGRCLHSFPKGKRLRYPLARQFVSVKKGYQTFLSLPFLTRLQIIGCSAAYWLAQFSILYTCLLYLGENQSWIVVASIQFLAIAAGRLTLLPAGAGGVEATSVSLLTLWVDPAIAASSVLLWRSVTLFPALIAGSLAMLIIGISLETSKSAFPEKREFYPH